MRRLALALLMPLLMLLSQQGAAWHEIGHWNSSQNSDPARQQQQRKDDPADKLCATCLSFAQLAATAYPDIPVLALADAQHVQAPATAVASLTATPPTARSRGPPTRL
jgi:hypothetical protein